MRRFDARSPTFAGDFAAFLAEPRGAPADVEAAVAQVIAEVRARGTAALVDFTARFDDVTLSEAALRVSPSEVQALAAQCPAAAREAITFAARRIGAYHERLAPQDGDFTDSAGVRLGWRWTPLAAVGIYVPGGRAAYPSTVLMNAVPARIAGVGRIAMVTPPGGVKPAVMAAAVEAGVTEIWRVGGAQAIAALAYGAGPIQPVDKIVGPGNAYVTAAKRRVYGRVGIDSLAGPSEVVVVADAANDPAWIAADLLAQAEHDPDAQSILITDDAAFADAVAAEVEALIPELSTGEAARASWMAHGAIVLARLEDAPALVDQIAPEHVEFAVERPDGLAARVRHAGAIFLGRHTPEAIGDYVGGSNHVLPTSGAARFSSGLSTLDFLKRTSILACDADAFGALAPAGIALAEVEGLPAHGLSMQIRTNRRP
ncbi:MAG TPA: histidinol dehydrogenase [Caulobacteraceae bacterium]|jgi:histidinol dehydrogenase|nr:histidinol dehydrogenase [Caulobacteraceae bacterium]